MKKLLFLFILMLSPMLASANDGDTFSEETVEGVLLKYTIISESEKTCMVGTKYYPAVPAARVRRGPENEVCQASGDITIPEEANGYRVVRVESFAFNQAAITSVFIPNSVKTIGNSAFTECVDLKSVRLSEQLTRIEGFTFNSCESLTNIDIPKGVTSIGDYAFYRCESFTNIDIPEGVTSIGDFAFANCKQLKEITIPSSVKQFGKNVFWNTGFTSLPKLPESLTVIPKSMFYECTQLTSIEIPENIIIIEECAFGRCPVSEIEIPASVNHIGVAVFANCINITDLTIPDNVTEIGMNAFWGCSNLKTVKLSANITSLNKGVFSDCNSLKDFYCCAEKVPEAESAFGNTNLKEVTLHVPAASVSAYQATEPWKKFKEIVALTNNPDTPKYFPTGMTWEEIVVDPYMELEDDNACIYEIGTDTIIGDITYKKVLKNNVFSGLCVRESGDKVWLLTKEYPTEILLYNFDWDNNQEIVTEYLKGQDENDKVYEVRQETTPVGDSQAVEIEGKTYQYIMKRLSGTLIRGIGKVAELNRYPCLLSYREPYQITPGLDYHKVHWIKRNGVEIFRSESAKEWTEEIRDDYRPFIEEGKVWKAGDTSVNPVQFVAYYYFDGDTIINGKVCKQMMCQRYYGPDYHNDAITFAIPPLRYIGAWYEEDKKVYYYDINNQLKMMYDFALEANDTLLIDNEYQFVIGPKQTGGLKGFKGVYRDVMLYWGGSSSYSTTWLEGVGSIDGPTNNIYFSSVNRLPLLMSCTVGDEVIYLNDEVEDGATPSDAAGARKNRLDFTHTIKTKPKAPSRRSEEISLYGEYNDLRLGIDLNPLYDTYQVRITDESGKVVYEKSINAGTIVGLSIDISAYEKGRYTVTVENSEETFTGEFETQPTGIEAITNKRGEIRHYIYNLHGQRLSSLQKGLNIVNGQKIFVK